MNISCGWNIYCNSYSWVLFIIKTISSKYSSMHTKLILVYLMVNKVLQFVFNQIWSFQSWKCCFCKLLLPVSICLQHNNTILTKNLQSHGKLERRSILDTVVVVITIISSHRRKSKALYVFSICLEVGWLVVVGWLHYVCWRQLMNC